MSLLTDTPPPRRSRAWIFAVIGALAAAGCAGAAYHFLSRPFSPLESPAGRALGRKVPTFLIESQENLRRGGAADAQKKRAALVLDIEDREALGKEVSDKLEDVLRTSVDVESAGDPPKELTSRFVQEGVSLNQALEAKSLPYFIDANVISSRRYTFPILYSYYIEREHALSGEGKQIRSLLVRRLDDLNFSKAAVGYTAQSSSAALVVIDLVESQLIEVVLPVAAGAEEAVLLDLDSIDPESPWQADLRAKTAAIVKGAYKDLPGSGAAMVEDIGKLFNRRRMLVRAWMKALDKQQVQLHIPRRYIPEGDYARDLMGHVPITELREWGSIHDKLQEKELRGAFDSMVERQARSVERHEAQHQLDFAREKAIVPKAVARTIGAAEDAETYDKFTLYVAGEVSAYLAEIADGPDSPALELMILLQSAFSRTDWGGAYCYAALAVLTGIAEALSIPPGELVGGGQIDRAALTKLLGAVVDKPEAEIRGAARKTWEAWYEAKLPAVTVQKATQNAAWRH